MSTDASDLEKKILEKAVQPEEYEIDGEKTRSRPIPDMIKLDDLPAFYPRSAHPEIHGQE